jgi:hypothetical protein
MMKKCTSRSPLRLLQLASMVERGLLTSICTCSRKLFKLPDDDESEILILESYSL